MSARREQKNVGKFMGKLPINVSCAVAHVTYAFDRSAGRSVVMKRRVTISNSSGPEFVGVPEGGLLVPAVFVASDIPLVFCWRIFFFSNTLE